MTEYPNETHVGPGYTRKMYQEEIDPKNFPVTVVLKFRSEDDKEKFVGGLSDGWGEDHCCLHEDWLWSREVGPSCQTFPIYEEETYHVTVFREEYEE